MNHDHDPLDRYLDAFGDRLDDAAARTASGPAKRRIPRLALLAGTATVVAVALTAALLILPGGTTPRRLDVLAEARAALAPRTGELTHLVVIQHTEAPPHREDMHVTAPPSRTEQWSATGPVRWRMTYDNPANVSPHPSQPVEVAYANRVEEAYYPKINHLRRVHGIDAHPAPAAYPLGTDPVAALRAMLARGTVRDTGTSTIGGREVRRLVGTRSRTFPRGKGRPPLKVVSDVEYDVDPTTFAPVQARIEAPIPVSERDRFVMVFDFETYERLPLTAGNEQLLAIHPRPGVSITETRAKR